MKRVMAQHNNLDTLVREGLRSKILNGDLEGGYHLSELKISKDYSVSRTPVREALCALAADGLVEMVPHRGAFVTHVPSQSKTDQLRAYGLFLGLAAKLAAENANIEMLLDLETAFSFAQNESPSSDQYLSQLEAALEITEKTANSPSVSDALNMIRRRANMTEMWAMSLGQRKELNNQFGLLMAALKRKKADAAEKTMRQIVTLASNAYLASNRKAASAADSVATDMTASMAKKNSESRVRAN